MDIAIVGIAATLPGGHGRENLDYASLYQFLLEQDEAYEKIPAERFNIHTLQGSGMGQVKTDTGSFLKDIHLFDYLEFGITMKDARLLPVATRKLVETSFLSLLDSGIDYRGQNVGCYMSGVAHDIFSISGYDDAEARGSFAYPPATIANRVSYHLDLRGPSVPVDTACSSSMYATHLAVQAIRNGECDAAVVGGAQINHRWAEWILYSQGGVLSPDGKCKPFDKSADGFGRGEGIIVMVLKPLEKAIRDHDKIYATILGTGVNSCGSLAPVNAPVASAQKDAMKRAFAQARRSPREADFVELHATGTAMGDPTEANWAGEEFGRDDDELLVGSIKGNIGHLEISSFLASLCKVCWMIQTRTILPTVNVTELNPSIRWREFNMRVPTRSEPLRSRSASGRPLIAMTSSGIVGANGHCVVEGPPTDIYLPCAFWTENGSRPSLIIAAGLTPRSASAMSDTLRTIQDKDVQYLSRVLGRRMRSLTWRSFSVKTADQQTAFTNPSLVLKETPHLVFVFCGQGPQYYDMGRELFHSCLVFRNCIVQLDQHHRSVTGYSLIERYGIFDQKLDVDPLGAEWPIAVTLPALAIVQIALFDTLTSLGAKPAAVLGHSAGETAVLYASGSASKEMALELAIARGKAMSLLENSTANGSMAAVSCAPEQAHDIISEVNADIGPGVLDIACFNDPNAVTLSGAEAHVERAVAKAQALGIFARKLRTRVPVHSAMMESCRVLYGQETAAVFARHSVTAPGLKLYSTKTGELFNHPFDSEYFWDSTRGPVQFTRALQSTHKAHPTAIYVEIAPHPVLATYISNLVGTGAHVVCPLRRYKPVDVKTDAYTLLDCLGKVVVTGYNGVDFDLLCHGAGSRADQEVSYPFSPKEIPYFAPTYQMMRQKQHRNGPLNYPQLALNAKTHLSLVDHIIKDEPIMPAAGYLEMALEFGARQLWNVELVSLLALSSERPMPIQVQLDGYKWSVKSETPSIVPHWPPEYNRLHACGYLSMDMHPSASETKTLDIISIQQRLTPLHMKDFYMVFSSFAQYGLTYRRVVGCSRRIDERGYDEVLVEIRGPSDDIPEFSDYVMHPAILDAAIHVSVHPYLTGYKQGPRYYLPSKLGLFVVHEALIQRRFSGRLWAYGKMVEWCPTHIKYDFQIVNDAGEPLCTIDDLEVALHGNIPVDVTERFEVIHKALGPSVQQGDIQVAQDSSPRIVLQYLRGNEMAIQSKLATVNQVHPSDIWIFGRSGTDGDSALGFTRSLRREYAQWRVFVVVHEEPWTVDEIHAVSRKLALLPALESEIYIDCTGTITVPRIAPALGPITHRALQSHIPWFCNGVDVIQVPHCTIPKGSIMVDVEGCAVAREELWTFVGHIRGTPVRVGGLATGPLSNVAVVPRQSVTELATTNNPDILLWLLALVPLGSRVYRDALRLHSTTVLVTQADGQLEGQIGLLYEALGVRVHRLPSNAQLCDVRRFASSRPNVIITSSTDEAEVQVYRDLLCDQGTLFVWPHALSGLPHKLAADPDAIGDALKYALSSNIETYEVFVPPLQLISHLPQNEVRRDAPLLDSNKAYVLVGGIGSLGLEIANWVYTNGAKHIILTSRSGRTAVTEKGSFLSKRMLEYLSGLPDLDLRTVAVNAVSLQDMHTLCENIGMPIGGCILLAVTLQDRMFAGQTEESFEAPFIPKVGAFEVLESVLPIDSLDFLVTFSSVSGMFGNAGQTNYASANTALAGLTKKYRNAFSLVCPAIYDSAIAVQDESLSHRISHLTSWGMSASDLCTYLGDGLRKLRDGPVWQYIPSLDWKLVQKNLGPLKMYDDLVTNDGPDEDGASDSVQPQSLKSVVCRVLDVSEADLSPDVPFTSYGLDSLSAASLSHSLAPIISISQIQLLADLTLRQLEDRLLAQSGPEHSTDDNEPSQDTNDRVRQMLSVVERYTQDLASQGRDEQDTAMSGLKTVLITGTTGSLGAHMLEKLLGDDLVSRVYVLLRKRHGDQSNQGLLETQTRAFEIRGLSAALLHTPKVVYVAAELDCARFGLQEAMYQNLVDSVTHIAHIGWDIDFSSPLTAYEPAIRGLRHLVDLALSAARCPAKLVFASSAGMFRNFDLLPPGPISERPITDPHVVVGTGYTESKWVAERLLEMAAEKTALRPSIVRLHQLSGSPNGAWKHTQWFPSMVASSIALGCVPTSSAVCSWLPVDVAAAATIDMLDSTSLVMHVAHPKPAQISDIMRPIATALDLPLVPYTEWFKRLEEQSARVARGELSCSAVLEAGIRLLEVYRMPLSSGDASRRLESFGLIALLGVDETVRQSKTLGAVDLRQLGAQDVDSWLRYWRESGFLPLTSIQ